MAKVLFLYPNLTFQMQMPNHLPVLSACLKAAGHSVRLFDTTFYKLSDKTLDDMRTNRLHMKKIDLGVQAKTTDMYADFQECVSDFRPDIIGVTAVDNTVDLGLELIQSLDSHVLTIFGGKHATFNPENLLLSEGVDMVCIGDGEEAIVEICQAIDSNTSWDNIKNIWVKHGNKIIKNKLRPPMPIDNIPFDDFYIFGEDRLLSPIKDKMRRMISISIDRGCPYTCTFCGSPAVTKIYKDFGYKFYRFKSIERLEHELEYQINKYNPEYINMNSETLLNMTVARLKEFARVYAKYALPFWSQTRPETISEEKIKILKDMNCNSVGIGLDHGNEEFRKKMLNKHYTNKQLFKAFDILNKYDMRINVNCIIGFPDETRELAFDTIRLARKLNYYSIMAFTFQPYYGTVLRDYCIKKGYLKTQEFKGLDNCLAGSTLLDMPQFRPDEIEGVLRTFNFYCKLPEKHYPRIHKAESDTPDGNQAFGELKNIYYGDAQ